MQVGLLWYDDDPRRSLAEKIGQAARRHLHKYDTIPTVCYVHPSTLASEEYKAGEYRVDGIRVMVGRFIMPHYFWIGRDPEPTKSS